MMRFVSWKTHKRIVIRVPGFVEVQAVREYPKVHFLFELTFCLAGQLDPVRGIIQNWRAFVNLYGKNFVLTDYFLILPKLYTSTLV